LREAVTAFTYLKTKKGLPFGKPFICMAPPAGLEPATQ
jgi:hypothetical protein